MASRVLVSGLPRSLPPLPPGPAPSCVPCVEGRQRAAPHSSKFPPTEASPQTLHMDMWGPSRVRGQGHERYFLLVVDEFSRYTSLFPLRRKDEVTEVLIEWIRVARLQLRERFGSDFPVLHLHSDRGQEFSSDLLRAFCRAEGIRQTFMLPASPQKNGIAERRIGMVMDVALSAPDLRRRLQPQDTCRINLELFQILRRAPSVILRRFFDHPRSPYTDLTSSQKRLADRHRRDHTIAVGDHVLLDTCNLNLGHLPSKLRPRFSGPFLVEEQVTPVTFRLRLPASWKIHNAFHVQLLKPYQDPNKLYTGRQPPPPPPVLVNDELEYEVESVLAHRRRRHGAQEFLVRWKGYDPSEDSWVSEEDMSNARCSLRDYLVKQDSLSIPPPPPPPSTPPDPSLHSDFDPLSSTAPSPPPLPPTSYDPLPLSSLAPPLLPLPLWLPCPLHPRLP
ncbi:unnamed protein product [Closterium sp. NIES-53]